MSVNSSFNSSLHLFLDDCSGYTPSIFNFVAFTTANILLLPLFIFVLYLGLHRTVSPAAMTSHSDIFTYNVVVLELISVLGSCLYCTGALTDSRSVIWVSMNIFSITSPAQTLFHLLTCVERYLAVVHPITYLGLRQSGGVRIRNVSIGCVWLTCFALLGGVQVFNKPFQIIAASFVLVFSLVVVSFCSLFLLWVLIRPGPGDVGGDGKRVDQTKRRAFYTIIAIMGALVLRFVGILVGSMLYVSVLTQTLCLVQTCSLWLTLPSSLVLPLLFLHRAGKLPGCTHSSESA